jgi:hypothetical protein
LPALQTLVFRDHGLERLDVPAAGPHPSPIRTLSLEGGKLTRFPDMVKAMPQLEVLDLSKNYNMAVEIPYGLAERCPSLKFIDLLGVKNFDLGSLRFLPSSVESLLVYGLDTQDKDRYREYTDGPFEVKIIRAPNLTHLRRLFVDPFYIRELDIIADMPMLNELYIADALWDEKKEPHFFQFSKEATFDRVRALEILEINGEDWDLARRERYIDKAHRAKGEWLSEYRYCFFFS